MSLLRMIFFRILLGDGGGTDIYKENARPAAYADFMVTNLHLYKRYRIAFQDIYMVKARGRGVCSVPGSSISRYTILFAIICSF